MVVNATSQPSPPESKPPVAVKGTKDGLLFLLDERCDFSYLLQHLTELLTGETSAVFEGPEVGVAVDYGARILNADEIHSLLQLFLSKTNFQLHEWGPSTAARQHLVKTRSKPLQQSIYKGTVRAGQRLVFDGDVVVIGDVNPGGEVAATGDIYIFGKLNGIAHAGLTGDVHSIIAAADFSPMQLRIANTISRAPEEKGRALHTFMEFAYLRDDGMAVDKMQFMPYLRQKKTP